MNSLPQRKCFGKRATPREGGTVVLASMIGNTSAGGSCQGRGWRFSGKREMGQPINTGSRNVVENLFTRIGFLLSSIIVSGLSSDLTAVYFVAMILLGYSFSFGDGLQAAVLTLTGQSMGAGQYREVRDYVRLSRIAGAVVSVALGAVYILGARKFFSHYFQDEKAIAQGVSYTYVAAALAFLQIIRIINVAAMRGMGDAKSPRIMATVCVLLVNPAVAFMLTSVLPCGVWGIWIASLTSQLCWFTMSCVLARRCMREALRSTA